MTGPGRQAQCAADLSAPAHAVLFYADHELSPVAGSYLAEAVRDGGVAIVVATPDHRAWINDRVARAGFDLAAIQAEGSYLVLDAHETLSRFMVGGAPDPQAFRDTLAPVLAHAARRRRPVRVFGEMVAVLWGAGLPAAAVELEHLWNEAIAEHGFELLCAYPVGAMTGEGCTAALAEIVAAHTMVLAPAPPLRPDAADQ
jgi:hypothetical protein